VAGRGGWSESDIGYTVGFGNKSINFVPQRSIRVCVYGTRVCLRPVFTDIDPSRVGDLAIAPPRSSAPGLSSGPYGAHYAVRSCWALASAPFLITLSRSADVEVAGGPESPFELPSSPERWGRFTAAVPEPV